MNLHPRLTAILSAALLCVATTAHAQVYAEELDGVERYTDAGESNGKRQYKQEHGVLSLKGEFVLKVSPLTMYYDDQGGLESSPTTAEVAAVAGKFVIRRTLWDTMELAFTGYFSHNFARSSTTYPIAGVPYYIVNVADGGTNPNGGGGSVGGSPSGPRLVNMSFRAVVPANGNIIPGFVIADTPNHDKLTVLIRVSGPSLAVFGVGGTLSDPKITVYNGSTPIAENDNWCDTDKANILAADAKTGAFTQLDNSKDAAILLTLSPGAYTAFVNGPKDTSGEVLVEVYAVEN